MFTKDVRKVEKIMPSSDMTWISWIPKQWYLCKGVSFDGWSTNATLGFNSEVFPWGDGYLHELSQCLKFCLLFWDQSSEWNLHENSQIPNSRFKKTGCFCMLLIHYIKKYGFPSSFLSSHFGKKNLPGGWIKHDFLYSIEMNQCRWARNHSHIKSNNDKRNKCQLYNLRSYNLQLSIVWRPLWSALSGETPLFCE